MDLEENSCSDAGDVTAASVGSVRSSGEVADVSDVGEPLPRLKILAIHGYSQNGTTFKAKIGSFRKVVSKYAELTFLTAPHAVKDRQPDDGNDADMRGWWFNSEDCTFKALRVGGPAVGFTETLKLIEDTFEKHGPFDGLMGFSQGASLVGILAAMQQKGLLSYKFKFVILVAGFCSESLVHKGFYDEDITLPSLHVYGETDKIIPKEMSETLAGLFSNPISVEHEGGHYVACTGSIKHQYKDFLSDMRDDEVENSKLLNQVLPNSSNPSTSTF